MVEKGKFLVAQESDDEVVVRGDEVERVGEEERQPSCGEFLLYPITCNKGNIPMICAYERHAQKLHHV